MSLFMFCFNESKVKGSNLKLYNWEFSITVLLYMKSLAKSGLSASLAMTSCMST